MKIREIPVNGTGTVEGIILSVEEKVTKVNDSYLKIGFGDGDQKISVKKWNSSLKDFPFKKGSVVFMTLRADSYDGGVSYSARDEIVESHSDPGQFIATAPVPPEAMFNFLLKTGERCGPYAGVVTKILTDCKSKLLVWSGGKKIHHNLRGGLLYHMYRMTKCAAYIANVYNKCPSMLPGCRDINTELLVAGTILHDIGKLEEMETDSVGEADYTPKGAMMGHLFIGAEIVGRYARSLKLDEESTMLLQHMILSHHGLYEYQTVAVPAIPEAVILHSLDMMDSRLYQFEAVAADLEPGTMSERIPSLGAPVYRPSWRIPE